MSGWNRVFVPSFGEMYYHEKKSNKKKKNKTKTKFDKDADISLLEKQIEILKVKIQKHDWNLSLKTQLIDKEKILLEVKGSIKNKKIVTNEYQRVQLDSLLYCMVLLYID